MGCALFDHKKVIWGVGQRQVLVSCQSVAKKLDALLGTINAAKRCQPTEDVPIS